MVEELLYHCTNRQGYGSPGEHAVSLQQLNDICKMATTLDEVVLNGLLTAVVLLYAVYNCLHKN